MPFHSVLAPSFFLFWDVQFVDSFVVLYGFTLFLRVCVTICPLCYIIPFRPSTIPCYVFHLIYLVLLELIELLNAVLYMCVCGWTQSRSIYPPIYINKLLLGGLFQLVRFHLKVWCFSFCRTIGHVSFLDLFSIVIFWSQLNQIGDVHVSHHTHTHTIEWSRSIDTESRQNSI